MKPEKIWPVERYAELARALAEAGLQVAVVGGAAEADLFALIAERAPGSVDLTGKTDLVALASLGTRARLAVGNDTGPTHLLAYAGTPGLMLMSRVSDPTHCGPRGPVDAWLSAEDLRTPGRSRPAVLAGLPGGTRAQRVNKELRCYAAG